MLTGALRPPDIFNKQDSVRGLKSQNPLPYHVFTQSITSTSLGSRRALNSVARSPEEKQVTTVAEGSSLRLIYGLDRVGAQIAFLKEKNGFIYVSAIWCAGEINSVVKILFDDVEQPTWVVESYVGTTTQTTNSVLNGLWPDYVDDNIITKGASQIGACYSILKIPATKFPSSIIAEIEGRLVYDPRTTLTEYSTNPTLHLRDFITSGIYGQGKQVIESAVIDCANANDEIVGGAKRRQSNYTIDKQAKTSKYVEALRTYAACFVVPSSGKIKLVPFRPATITRPAIEQIENESFKITKLGMEDTPTVMIIWYQDTSTIPWKKAPAIAKTPGVIAGTDLWIESHVNLYGINTYAQAYREAVERLNDLRLTDLSVEFVSYDESLQDEIGDVIPVTHSLGLTDKPFRIVKTQLQEPGRWKIFGKEYNENVFSDDVQTEPDNQDTTLPTLFNPLPATNVTATEEVFQQISQGTHSSRLRISWDAPDYPFIQSYRIVVKRGVDIVFETNTIDNIAVTGAVMELEQHDIFVYVYSGIDYSSPAINNITPKGKYLPPPNVQDLTGFEAGGEVFLSWSQVFDVDMWNYEIRYDLTSGDWDSATVIDRVDALRLSTKEVPAGEWRFFVKALDSVGNYSDNSTFKDLTVSLDANAFLLETYDFDTPITETNLHQYTLERSSDLTYDVSYSGQTWAAMFPLAMSTYTNNINSYQNDVLSEFLSETKDFGLELSGNWSAEVNYDVISGSVVAQLELSTDNFVSDLQVFTSLNTKATARYARIRIKSDVGLFKVVWPVMNVRVDAIPKQENGTGVSVSTAGGYTVILDNDYVKAKSITITPLSATAYTWTIDNIDIVTPNDEFDVYLFDKDGIQTAGINFLWNFEGV
jgi:hypothetical protein